MALVEVKVPDIGDFKDVEVIELLVKPGDRVTAEQSLVTVESDKASMEIPSSHAGVVKEMRIKLGDKLSEGSALLQLEVEGEGPGVVAGAGAPPSRQVPSELARPPSPQALAAAEAAGSPPTPSPAASAAPAASHAPAAPAAPAAAPPAGGTVEVVVPDIGDFADVAVIEVMVKPGDRNEAEQSLVTVESDKASMEIPSSHAGIVKELRVKVGDKVSKGSPVVLLEAAGGAAAAPAAASASAPASAGAPAPSAASSSSPAPVPRAAPAAGERHVPTAALPAHEPAEPKGALPHASPTIRKLARELGVPLEEIKGSGPKGRITQEDVQGFVRGVMSGSVLTRAQAAKAPAAGAPAGGAFPGLLAWPQVDFAKFGPIERKDLSRIKKISAANLHRNWVLIPHVTNHDDADITELEAFRVQTNKENEKAGIKVTMLAFLIKACVAALKKFPEFNASLDGEQLVLKRYFHIGFAADTPNGLVVPVLKDADQKGVLQISEEMSALAKKARDGKLSPTDMSGGCFSISSLGGIGGRYFTPIINAPEVAILGVCRSAMEPVWDGKAFQPRLMLPLSLSWDHRVIDGAAAARFNAYLAQILADFRRVLL
jgi:pyruvate dehydrogenase E2 component (dihydrolipoamide acetyltransferase)